MELVLFADNCLGQNKNRYIIQMMSLTVRKFKNLKSIELVFLERGHTQNENDSIHSTIEKSKKTNRNISPFPAVTLVQEACKRRPCIFGTTDIDDFLSFETSLNGEYAILIKISRGKQNKKKQKNQVE